MIDAHQHFWTIARKDYGWLTPEDAVLYRDYGPADLAPHLQPAGITQTVVVQAAPTVDETRYLLALADETPWVAGVVGWVDLGAPDVAHTLDALASHRLFRGVRPMIQDIADDDWMLGDALTAGFQALVERDLGFDALVLPRHLPRLLRLLGRHPDLRVVVDHGAKPAIRDGAFDDWAQDVARLARETGACCKLSGLVAEADAGWQEADLRPYAEHLLACFGPERLLWGSDWPVVELAGGFERWRRASNGLLAGISEPERDAVLGGSATRFYRLDPA
jgi:L-fuconolactonase